MRVVLALLLVALATSAAAAQEVDYDAAPKPRPFRFSIGAGGSLLFTGLDGGPRNRADGHLDISPGGVFGRYGLTAALRHVIYDPAGDDGMATLGLLYEAAAARPRLVLSLHADAGVTLAETNPVIGGGIETHFWIWPKRLGPLALVLDTTGHVVIDGVDDTRLVLGSAARLAIAF